MMETPRFVTLAQVDRQHFISACRHGMVHMTWGRSTLRLSRDELRLLATLLDRAVGSHSGHSVSQGGLTVTFEPGTTTEIRLGTRSISWVLALAPDPFHDFHQAVREAVKRLEEILKSGIWDKDESTEEEAPPNPLELLRRVPFSRN